MKVEYTKEEREENIDFLKKKLKGNMKVYSAVKYVSNSGMSRGINFYIFAIENKEVRVYDITYLIAGILDYPYNENKECLKVSGCGMDMCFSVVYNLGSVLYPNGDGKTITGRNGDKTPETDGGYLLKSEHL